jgi:hypothetical protein
MSRGGHTRLARRLMAAAAMLGLGVAVVGGGVAFADDSAGSGAPVAPGVVTNYRVDTPSLPVGPVAPAQPGSDMVALDTWDWT